MPHERTALALHIVATAAGLAAFLMVALVSGPVPGDVAITRAIQALVPADAEWTARMTGAAKMPWLLASLALSAATCFWMAGWRGLLLLALAMALAFTLDAGLRASFHVPKPTADMVAVLSPSASSGLPSTFALRFGAMLGVPLLLAHWQHWWAVFWLVIALFAAGFIARVAPGGHWPSQMLATWGLMLPLIAWITRRLAPERCMR